MDTKSGKYNELEEIYRVQAGEKIFIYFKEDEGKIFERDFFRQNDLYILHNGRLEILRKQTILKKPTKPSDIYHKAFNHALS